MVSARTSHEQAGAFTCDPPWESVHLSDEAAALLGRPDVRTLDVSDGTGTGPPELGAAVRSAVRTNRTQVRTLPTLRAGGGAAVVTTIVTPDGRSAAGAPHVSGWIVDVTDELAAPYGELDGIAVVIRGPVAAVVAAGEFDISRREAFRAALVAAATAGSDVYLDTRHVRFFEARAVAMLADLAAVLAPDHELVVVDPPPVVRLVLSVCPTEHDAGIRLAEPEVGTG